MPRLHLPTHLAVAALLVATLTACDTSTGRPIGLTPDVVSPPDTTTPDDTATTTPDDVVTPAVLALVAVDPARGSTAGLDEVQITGTGLSRVQQVLFGESPATEFFAVSDRLIVAMSPPRPGGLVDVTVIDGEGVFARLDQAYNYRDDVQITLVEPARGHWLGGEPITVHGAGFAAGATVVIGGRAAPIVDLIDPQTLTAVTPAGAPGRVDVFVSSRDGVARYAPGFLYDGGPRIDVVTPTGGALAGGYTLTLEGAGFFGDVTVRVGGRLLTAVTVDHAGRLTGTVPPGTVPGPADVAVVTESGAALASGAFHYLASGAPGFALLSVHPNRGAVSGGERAALAVTGLAPTGAPTVTFDGRPANVVSWSAATMSVVVVVPAGAAAGPASVAVQQGPAQGALPGAWTYLASAHVGSVAPATGPATGGTPVVISGSGFVTGATVRIGALPATEVRVISSSRLEAVTAPGSPGLADVRVSQGGVDAVLASGFVYGGSAAVWVVDPPSGAVAGGTRVRVVGYGFTVGQPVQVLFGGTAGAGALVLDANTIEVRTPRGLPGPVAVTVSGGGVEATHPNGFAYFDPASFPGTWGDPVAGTLNVTVIDGGNGTRLGGASVVLGKSASSPYRGTTDDQGQYTFSDLSLVGDQIVTASRDGYQTGQLAGFDATNVTVALLPVPTCEDIADIPCDQLTEPGPVAFFNGRILGSTKAPTIPWGECRDWEDAPDGLCDACDSDDDCTGAGQRCAELPGEGFFCTSACQSDADCTSTFVCEDVTNEGKARQCVPPPGEIRVYCDITETDMYAEDAIAYPGVLATAQDTVAISTRLGNYAVFCWRGRYVRAEFRPEVMGVTRHLGAFANGDVVEADIRLDIPIKRRVTVEVDRPTMGTPNEETTTLRTLMNLGGDGVLEFPPLRAITARTFNLKLPALTGAVSDASWDFYVQIDVPSLQGYSATIAAGIRDIADDLNLALGADGWELHADVPATTRGVASVDGEVLAVGDGGRIARSFGENHWALQASGTERDLYAVAVDPSGIAIAVGAAGVATHWDGFLWHVIPTDTVATLEGVAITAADEAYAVGGGRVLRFDGAAWSEVFDAAVPLHGVWTAGPGDAWVVGDSGYAAHLDGGTWTTLATGTASHLRAIWGAPGVGPLVAGDDGTLLRYTDGAFAAEGVPTTVALLALWGDAPDRIFAVGSRGTVLRFDGATWQDASNPDHKGTLRAVGGAGPKLRAMGSHELVLGPMLAIPTHLNPPDGSFLTDRLAWTVAESVTPHFTMLDFQSQAGPCYACGAYFMIPYSDWRSVLDGDLNEAWFPVQSTGFFDLFGGVESLSIYRVLVNDRFDFDHTANNGFFDAGWKSWAVRSATYIR